MKISMAAAAVSLIGMEKVAPASARAGRIRTFKAVDARDKADAEQKLRVMADQELRLHRNDRATPNQRHDGYDDERLARAAQKRALRAARRKA